MKVLVVFGTRPEAIKMSPVITELGKNEDIQTVICVTGQHRHMLSQVLEDFDIRPDYNLDIMKSGQNLFDVTQNVLGGMREIIEKERPDIVLVHGDTTTTFATALAAFYLHVAVGHVEAGLRTGDLQSPYPEEFNRKAVAIVTNMHFAPTSTAKENLVAEGYNSEDIYVTGNTAIDALRTTFKTDYTHPILDWANGSRLILLTAHRRENLGNRMHAMFRAIVHIVRDFPDVKVIYPVHMNPVVSEAAHEVLGEHERIKLIEPLGVSDFHNFMARAHLIMTDSGGIQEEAPFFNIPVLVMRDKTERPEGIKAGTLMMAGTDEQGIYQKTSLLLKDKGLYDRMSKAKNPYGDGFASRRIVEAIIKRRDICG